MIFVHIAGLVNYLMHSLRFVDYTGICDIYVTTNISLSQNQTRGYPPDVPKWAYEHFSFKQ